jgi:hypothetical protein
MSQISALTPALELVALRQSVMRVGQRVAGSGLNSASSGQLPEHLGLRVVQYHTYSTASAYCIRAADKGCTHQMIARNGREFCHRVITHTSFTPRIASVIASSPRDQVHTHEPKAIQVPLESPPSSSPPPTITTALSLLNTQNSFLVSWLRFVGNLSSLVMVLAERYCLYLVFFIYSFSFRLMNPQQTCLLIVFSKGTFPEVTILL